MYSSWEKINWSECEQRLNELQIELTKACFNKHHSRIKWLQMTICNDFCCKALAVKRVCSKPELFAGVDRIVWQTNVQRYNAILSLNPPNYQSKPTRRFQQLDEKKNKIRNMGVATMFDRAMQTLYAFALDPVAEAYGDRKSFAFRKGRSAQDACRYVEQALLKKNAPQWVLVGDIKSCYDTISHKWLMQNIPMSKYALNQFLSSGVIFNGSFFPTEEGILLGNPLSPILGNMTLDGLEKVALSIQNEPIDYENGQLIRFADDFVVLCKTKEYAEQIKSVIEDFLQERGLILSPTKTKLVNVSDGFEFLSWHIKKMDDCIRIVPSSSAISWFYEQINKTVKEYVCGDQDTLIKMLNTKIRGFSTYHKTVFSQHIFKQADIIIEFILLKWLRKINPELNDMQIRDMYWRRNNEGKWRFATINNTIIKLQEIPLVVHDRVITAKDPYINADYFKDRSLSQSIKRVSGKYRTIWDRQKGCCYICNERIKPNEYRELIKIDANKEDNSIKNLAYIHSKCKK